MHYFSSPKLISYALSPNEDTMIGLLMLAYLPKENTNLTEIQDDELYLLMPKEIIIYKNTNV